MNPKPSNRLWLAGAAAVPVLFAVFVFALPTPDDAGKPDTFGPVGPSFVIRNARLFDGREMRAGQSILVENGRIGAIGKDVAMTAGFKAFDGRGVTVLPGLIDSHVHAFGDAPKAALAFGVTTELDMFTASSLLPSFRKGRESLSTGTEADVFSAGILATAPKGHGTEYGMPVPTLTQASEADAWVEARVAEGSDFIKVVVDDGSAWGLSQPTLDRATVGALVKAAHARKKLAVAHAARLADARMALEEGADGLVHVFGDAPADGAFVTLAKSRGVFVVPTLTVLESISGAAGQVLADADLSPFLDAGQRQLLGRSFGFAKKPKAVETALANVRLLARAGVPLLAGTDASNPGTAHGASLHRELELLVSAGLSPLEALRAATSVPAARFGLPERGLLAPGMRADLVVVAGDPSEAILATRKIVAVYRNGRFVVRAKVDPAALVAPPLPAGPLGDFEDGTAKGGFGGGWQATSDEMRGGASTARLAVVGGGASGTGKALRVEGEIKAGFPYPWAGAIFLPGTPPFSPVDASSRRELVFRAKGDGRTYRVMVFTSAAQIPAEKTFATKETWTEIRVPLSEFPGATFKGLQAIGFSAGTEPGAFRLEIDEVELR